MGLPGLTSGGNAGTKPIMQDVVLEGGKHRAHAGARPLGVVISSASVNDTNPRPGG